MAVTTTVVQMLYYKNKIKKFLWFTLKLLLHIYFDLNDVPYQVRANIIQCHIYSYNDTTKNKKLPTPVTSKIDYIKSM